MSTTSELWMKVIESDGSKRIRNLNKLSLGLWEDGEYDAAIAVEQEIRDRYLDDSRVIDWLWSSWVVASRYFRVDDFQSSRLVVDEVLNSEYSDSDDLILGYIHNLGGEIKFELGEFRNADKMFNKATQLFQTADRTELVADTQRRLAKSFIAQERWIDARNVLVSATEEYAKVKNLVKTVETRVELADVLVRIGKFESALPVLGDGLQIARFLENIVAQQAILRRMGECYSVCRNDKLAFDFLNQAIKLKSKVSQPAETLKAMESLAKHNSLVGNKELARKQFNQISPLKKILEP